MTLRDFLKAKRLKDHEFAYLLGGCSAHAVKKWKYGEREPDASTILKIEETTGGLVTLKDWVTPRVLETST